MPIQVHSKPHQEIVSLRKSHVISLKRHFPATVLVHGYSSEDFLHPSSFQFPANFIQRSTRIQNVIHHQNRHIGLGNPRNPPPTPRNRNFSFRHNWKF